MDSRPNVIIITVDALRADHLGCYGYHRSTSPSIDALAREGVLAEQMLCPVIPTQPSFTTLYTGQLPLNHGVIAHGGKTSLANDAPFLPQLFLDADYTTCALDNLWRGRPWFGRGYEFYIDPSLRYTLLLAVPCAEINKRAIPWLRSHANEQFFMFLHYWDPHYPYAPPQQYRSLFYEGNPADPDNHALDAWWSHPIGAIARDTWLRTPNGPATDPEYVIALYDQEIRYVDDGIGEMLSAVDDLGLTRRTLVVLLADHGESMTEHGIFFDHYGLYDCTLRIPLIARWPGHLPAGVRLSSMLQMHDIAPTLLELAGLSVPRTMDGRSFRKLMTGEEQTGGYEQVTSLECTWQAKWSLRTDTHKLILSREPDLLGNPLRELYDLRSDPHELDNLAEAQPEMTATLEDALESWISERLRALGQEEDPVRVNGPSMAATWLGHLQ